MSSQGVNRQNLDQLRYIILPQSIAPNSHLHDLKGRAYQYWTNFWKGVFKQNGIESEVHFEHDFARMNLVALLLAGEQIAGMHLYGYFDLRDPAQRGHKYFAPDHGAIYLQEVDARRHPYVMSMEYLTVDPAWRRSQTGLAMGSVLLSLGTRVQAATGADASLGISRQDVGVDRMLRDLGAVEFGQRKVMYNTPIAYMCTFTDQIIESADPLVRHYVNKYWNERTDFSQWTVPAATESLPLTA